MAISFPHFVRMVAEIVLVSISEISNSVFTYFNSMKESIEKAIMINKGKGLSSQGMILSL